MKSIHLVFTMLLLMAGIAGYGNSTADLDKNLETETIEFTQMDLKSVDAEVLSIDFTQAELTAVGSVQEVVKLKLIESYKLLEDLSSTALKLDKKNRSWHNYNFKLKSYDYNFTARLPKANRIRILCMFS